MMKLVVVSGLPGVGKSTLSEDLAKKYAAKLVIIECVLEESLHKKRVEQRIRNLPEIPEITWKDVLERKKIYLSWKEKRLVVDTAVDRRQNLKKSFRLSYK